MCPYGALMWLRWAVSHGGATWLGSNWLMNYIEIPIFGCWNDEEQNTCMFGRD